jgi:hypothetical protein
MTIKVRALDPISWDFIGEDTYLYDLEAVAQIAKQRLLLFSQEWFMDLSEGTPVFTQILGPAMPQRQQQALALLLQQRILSTPYVTAVSDLQISFNSATRGLSFSCTITTPFGTIPITNQPAPGASATLSV